MTWKINELIQALKDQEVEMAVKDGEMDRLVLQKLMRITKDRRYRRKKSAQNLQRVNVVAKELRRECGVRRLGRDAGRANHDYSSRL